jgi:hypothetical protein
VRDYEEAKQIAFFFLIIYPNLDLLSTKPLHLLLDTTLIYSLMFIQNKVLLRIYFFLFAMMLCYNLVLTKFFVISISPKSKM